MDGPPSRCKLPPAGFSRTRVNDDTTFKGVRIRTSNLVRRPAPRPSAGDQISELTGNVREKIIGTPRLRGTSAIGKNTAPPTEDTVYITIDEKPKAGRTPLKRLANITENPAVAFVSDRYHEDWSLLGWVMLWGRAQVLPDGPEHDKAQALLRLARALEERGFESLFVCEHTHIPVSRRTPFPGGGGLDGVEP